jgi:hypothetical protein
LLPEANIIALKAFDYDIISRICSQVVKMLIAVVALFVLCWAPVLIDNVLTAYGALPYIRTANLKHMATAFHLMAYFNR